MNLDIRTALTDDLPYLIDATLRLEQHERQGSKTCLELSAEFPARLREWFSSLLGQENALMLVAESEQGRVGFCLAFVTTQPNDFTVFKSHGLIQLLWTEESARKSGVGSRLLDTVESVFRELGIAYAEVFHAARNDEALRFWATHGYLADSLLCRKFF